MKSYRKAPSWLRKLIIAVIIIPLVLFALTAYIYKDKKSPIEILTYAFYKVFDPPVTAWPTTSPEHEGVNSIILAKLSDDISDYTDAFIVIRGGNIIFEKYFHNYRKNVIHSMAAMAKSVVGIPVLLTAMNEGKIYLEDPLSKYNSDLEDDPTRSKILIKHLAFHSSGLEDVDFWEGKQGNLTGWKKNYYENLKERFNYSMNVAPVTFLPGTRARYAGVGYYALAYAVTKSIQGTKNDNIKLLLKNKLMSPLQIPDTSWRISYGESYNVDGMKLYAFGSGASYTARAAARIGELFLNKGKWNNRVVINPDLIDEVLSRKVELDNIVSDNHGWILNVKNRWPSLPEDAFIGLGSGHQIITVVPSLDLIMVRFGTTIRDQKGSFSEVLDKKLFDPLMESIIGPSSRQLSITPPLE